MAAAAGFIVSVYDLDLAPLGERVLSLPIRVGRSSLNDVCVSHRLVSEFHARIEEVDGKLCVRDLSSKNGVLVEKVGGDQAARVAAQTPVDLEPYGYEFLLSPLLRVRVRPATGREAIGARHSHALGSVLGNVMNGAGSGAAFAVSPGASLAEDQLTEGFPAHDPGSPPGGARAPLAAQPSPMGAPAPGVAGRPAPAGHTSPSALGAPATTPSPPSLPAPGAHPAPAAARGSRGNLAQTAQQGSPPSLAPASISPAAQPYSSVFVEPPAGALELPPVPGSALNGTLPALAPQRAAAAQRSFIPQPVAAPRHSPTQPSNVAQPSSFPEQPRALEQRLGPAPAARQSTLFEPGTAPQPEPPRLAHTAWEVGPGTLPAAAVQALRPAELPGRSIEALALRGLRELAASLVPGQSVDSAGDVVQLVTKLHDAMEMFCRCFIPVREACSRFIPTEELERAAAERCRHGSPSYVAIERALEPRAVAAALLDWRNDDQDAPRAVEHILADLMHHHLGLAQAALEGTRALLEELSPLRIERQQPAPTPSVLSRLGLAGTREKELWEAFERRHAELESLGRTFRALFGEQFTRAYVAQTMPGSGPSL